MSYRYENEDVQVVVPSDWIDRTVVTFCGPSSAGFQPTIVITKDALSEGESIESYCGRQVIEIGKVLPSFKKISIGQVLKGALKVPRLEYSWKSGAHGELYQQQYYLLSNRMTGTVLVVTMSALLREKERMFELFEGFFQQLQLRGNDE